MNEFEMQLNNGIVIKVGLCNDDFIRGTQTIQLKQKDDKAHVLIFSKVGEEMYSFNFRYKDLTKNVSVAKCVISDFKKNILQILKIENCDAELLKKLISTAIQHIHIVDNE